MGISTCLSKLQFGLNQKYHVQEALQTALIAR
ncbi:hypothetical protein GMOD_00005831 [Pyrenophora seminiperda CCB06]|uniref:Uncharacterized protein n=1 Tax=Pyrenophora seminiperda CCB06 TaxID=1302712 RepID=A0A3M7M9Z0_9PLEO|nr:hypothetical protein GMOD_00005831 [Pyrenophora seminiperda CCB06]